MKKLNLVGITVMSAMLLTACSGSGGSYETLEDLKAAVEKAGVDCEPDNSVTEVDFSGKAMTCNSANILYVYKDPDMMQQWIEMVDEDRQGIIEAHWVIGKDWIVISNEETANKLQPKIGGEVIQIGSE